MIRIRSWGIVANFAVAAMGVVATPAWFGGPLSAADGPPRLRIERDMTVTYIYSDPMVTNERRIAFSPSGRRRIDAITKVEIGGRPHVDRSTTLVENLGGVIRTRGFDAANRKVIVLEQDTEDLVGTELEVFAAPPEFKVTRGDRETVAGQACTVWRLTDDEGVSEYCLTDYGLALRYEARQRDVTVSHVATGVTFDPHPPGTFDRPADWPAEKP